MEQKCLADKIAGILNTAPTSIDPEDNGIDETSAQIVTNVQEDEGEDEAILSKFRLANVDLLADLDEKYAGKKASRSDLQDSDSEEEEQSDVDAVSEASESEEFSVETGALEEENEEEEESDNEQEEDDSNFRHMSETNVSNQIQKGICVRNQVALWENLLEARIQLQKCLVTSNKLPQCQTFREMKEAPEFSNKVTETKTKLSDVLDKMLLLQNLLLKQFPETKNVQKKKTVDEDDEEIASDTEEEMEDNEEEEDGPKLKKLKLNEYEKEISEQYNTYKDYRNATIRKWNDKTRIVQKGGATSHSVLDQIEYNLSNREKLIKRTQTKRSQYEIIGETNTEEEFNKEIFDDDDFYHQLLRELIEVKSADVTDPVQLGRQWIQLQSLRSKMKRKIDTKATKGRKIRYAVHNKLVNFMAPIDENLYTEEAKNELFSSLFGKR